MVDCAGVVSLLSTFGITLSFGVFQDYYTRVFLKDNTPSEISWIGSVQLCLDFSMGLLAGRLFDAGLFREVMIVGSILHLFSFFMLSLAKPNHYYQVILSQGVGMGLGMGLVIAPAVALPAHYFRATRSRAMGLIFVGSSIGGVIFPVMLNHLINGRVGFGWGVRATAFLMTGLLLISNILMKPRLPMKKHRAPGESLDFRSIITDWPYWICVVASFLIFWGLFFPYFYLQLFAVLHGVDKNLAFYSITVMNAATIFGRTIPSLVADKYGPLNVAIGMTAVASALIFAMLGITNATGMFAFAFFYGFFSGAYVSLLSSILAQFARSVLEVGTRIGLAMFIAGFALLTGTPITGALLNPPKYTWWRGVTVSGVMMLSGVILLIISRHLVVKRKGTWRV